jgi:CO/xanthine dehydrogenase FAD-binding subunit
MNLNTINLVERPKSAHEITQWRHGNAWLAGGTWLFSEPQMALDTLIDLEGLAWPALKVSANGIDVAATCSIAALFALECPADWHSAALLRECCNALLASFKIWNAATVGGNICMSLPAGAMISLAVALEATLTLWPREGVPRMVPAADFVTDNHENILQPGELLREIHFPASALCKRFAFRRGSLVKLGRSAALLIGTQGPEGGLRITVTAATAKPFVLDFASPPSAGHLRDAIDAAIQQADYYDDPNGTPAYKRHLTYYFAEQIRAELAA